MWKTVQFAVPTDSLYVNEGFFEFRIGENYRDVIIGEVPIDRVKLATDKARPEFPEDAAGFWPDIPTDRRFADIGETMEFIPGEGAFFPFGTHGHRYFTDGGDPTTPGTGSNDTWQIWQKARFNCYIIHSWNQNWYSQWEEEPEAKSAAWSGSAIRVTAGLKEQLIQAKAHGLKIIPNFLTDTKEQWIRKQYGDSQKALEALGRWHRRITTNLDCLPGIPLMNGIMNSTNTVSHTSIVNCCIESLR